ncbi:hypothetical protein SAMN05216174_106350 [Actinokineospora iranica]|uniref:Uncharacterized protein n=1 Tax=Actinokineospora iranica TaxID=1271860 RepID=A0A1G6RJ83_9PSEU|nr:hypothetical protein SAMN05216174_106350 [Actinokineospora iranica]
MRNRIEQARHRPISLQQLLLFRRPTAPQQTPPALGPRAPSKSGLGRSGCCSNLDCDGFGGGGWWCSPSRCGVLPVSVGRNRGVIERRGDFPTSLRHVRRAGPQTPRSTEREHRTPFWFMNRRVEECLSRARRGVPWCDWPRSCERSSFLARGVVPAAAATQGVRDAVFPTRRTRPMGLIDFDGTLARGASPAPVYRPRSSRGRGCAAPVDNSRPWALSRGWQAAGLAVLAGLGWQARHRPPTGVVGGR